MRHGVDQLADLGDGIELLEDFTPQRFGVRFAVMHLATRKLPMAGEVSAIRPERQQERIVSLDHRSDHRDWCHFGADGPTGTGCIHAALPFDSTTLARTYDSSPLNV